MHKQSISINCNFKNHNKLNQVWLALVRPVCAGDWLMMMLIDDEMTTRTTRRWHHICQWNRPNENCYKCSHSLQTYGLGYRYTTHIQTWIIDCCRGWNSLVQLCSLSVTQWVSHSIIHSVGSLVSQSIAPSVRPWVRQSADQACLHSLSRRGCLFVCYSVLYPTTSFPVCFFGVQ